MVMNKEVRQVVSFLVTLFFVIGHLHVSANTKDLPNSKIIEDLKFFSDTSVTESIYSENFSGERKFIVKLENKFSHSRSNESSSIHNSENLRGSIYSVSLNSEELKALKQDSNVTFIEADSSIFLTENRQQNKEMDLYSWGLKAIGGELSIADNKLGEHIRVAVLDTGVSNIPDLEIYGGVSFVSSESGYYDDNGHGTSVAAIIAAKQNQLGTIGVAPKVELYSLKIMDSNGHGSYSQVIEAINWCIENEINIVNMSFGGKEYSKLLHETIQNAVSKGIIFIAAAGNVGYGEETELYPALYPEVISVGAVTKDYSRAEFSSTGREIDVVSPGVGILTSDVNGNFNRFSGTSAAASFVTGALSVLWSAFPDLSSEQITSVLYQSATPLGNKHEFGYGLINLAKALKLTDESFDKIYDDDFFEPILPPTDPESEIGILSSYKTGDGQMIYPGDTATVSLQLDGDTNGSNPHSSIEIKVYNPYSIIPIESYTYNNPPLKPEKIQYSWKTSSNIYPGTYKIVFHYPALPQYDDVFTVYVRQNEAVPTAPNNVRASKTQRSITLSWDISSEANNYHVMLNDEETKILPANVNHYTFTGLVANKSYNVGVAATNSIGKSDFVMQSVRTNKEVVFFLPGIAGTTLKDGSNTVWTPSISNLSKDLDELMLDDDGQPINKNVKPDKAMPDFYKQLIDRMKNEGYDVVEFAYDFRLANAKNTSILEQRINSKMIDAGVDKVSIVAHSMGGLIATKFVSQGNNTKINKFITLGTPYFGAPKALYIMKTGNFLGSFKDIFISDHLRKIAMRAQSVYDLLPSVKYFNDNNYYTIVTYNQLWNQPLVTEHLKTYKDTSDYIRYNVFVKSNDRLQEAELFHNSLDITNTLRLVDSYIIVGENIATPGKVFVNDYTHKYDFSPIMGDGTVPLTSSTIGGSLPGRTYYVQEEHSKLANNPLVQNQVVSILNNKNDNILNRSRAESVKTIKLKVECPVELHIYDRNGNHMGPTETAMYEENISLGSYYQDGDMKFALLNYDNYNVEIVGTDNGEMTYTVQIYKDESPEQTIRFEKILISPTTVIKSNTNIDGGVTLMVDNDSDGETDQIIPPTLVLDSEKSKDDIAPTVDYSVEGIKKNDWYSSDVQVKIFGSDVNSGIHHIEYKINDEAPQVYTDSIYFTKEGRYAISAIAFDNMGNASSVKSIKVNIDKYQPTDPVIKVSQADWTDQNVSVTFGGSIDTGSGVNKYQIKLNNGEWMDYSETVILSSPGETEIQARSIDYAGNISNIVSQNVKIDKKPPGVPALELNRTNWTMDEVILSLIDGTDTQSGILKSQIKIGDLGEWVDYVNPIKIVEEGKTTIYARTIDRAGNISEEASIQAKIDRSEPTAPNIVTTTLGWSNKDVKVSISNGVDNGSGVNRTEYRIGNAGSWETYSSPMLFDAEGITTIFARTFDNLGQVSVTTSSTISIDKTPPMTPELHLSTTDWTNSDIVLSISGGLDHMSGLHKVQYKVGEEGDWRDYTEEVVLIHDGLFNIYARSIDNAGNNSLIVSAISKIDKSVPEKPNIILSSNEWSNTKVYFSILHGTDNGSGVFKSQYKINYQGEWIDYTLAVPITVEGQTEVYSRTIDNVGNVSEEALSIVKVDMTSPSIPSSLRVQSKSETELILAWNFSTDNTYVKGYEIYKNDSYIGYSGTTEYRLTGLVRGTKYIFKVRSRDSAGNFSDYSNSLIIVID